MSEGQIRFGDTLDVPLRNGIYKPKQFHGQGAKIVNMGELFAHPRMRDVPMRRLEMSDKELTKASLQNGDLIFARRSLTAEGAGKCSIVLEVNEPTTFESSIIRARLDQENHSPLFYYYFFNSPQGKAALGSILRQVAVAGITGKDLQELVVPVVPPADQSRIAEMLGSLDDKIELNRRMNETLEEMARALFRDWFVDFGPTRRQIEGATDPAAIMGHAFPPEKAATLAPLFPAKLGDDGLPEGWNEQSVSELTLLLKRGAAPKYAETGCLVVNQKCIRNNTINYNLARRNDLSLRDPKLKELQVGDVLVNSTGVGTLGRVATVRTLPDRAMADTHISIVRPDPDIIEPAIVALLLETLQGQIADMGHGSTGQTELKPSAIGEIHAVISGREVQEAFGTVVGALRSKVDANQQENQTLAEMRDLLLPKLMSGEIRLKDVEAVR
ncbi:restriction endonuclease subunit S [Hirschia litorea]|uniref:Restriction endonuclease subunit S n=1 Tax=Hirschia litorea TaxID=1199156 RepID=A0ABW2IL31_9PROT